MLWGNKLLFKARIHLCRMVYTTVLKIKVRKQQAPRVCAEMTILMYIKQIESKQKADLCGLRCAGRLGLFFIYVLHSLTKVIILPMQRKVYEKGMAYSAGTCQKKA